MFAFDKNKYILSPQPSFHSELSLTGICAADSSIDNCRECVMYSGRNLVVSSLEKVVLWAFELTLKPERLAVVHCTWCVQFLFAY